MSGWDAYIDNIMGGSSAIKKAAIIGMDGAVWTRSEQPQQFAVIFFISQKLTFIFRPQPKNWELLLDISVIYPASLPLEQIWKMSITSCLG